MELRLIDGIRRGVRTLKEIPQLVDLPSEGTEGIVEIPDGTGSLEGRMIEVHLGGLGVHGEGPVEDGRLLFGGQMGAIVGFLHPGIVSGSRQGRNSARSRQ